MKKYERNIKLFLLYSLLTGKLFVGTTQVLFLTFKGFSFTQIMLISTITGVCSLIFEIPSGMVADKLGYKKCISSGLLFTIVGYIFILIAHSFVDIIIFSFLTALGTAVISGADYSLLYESLRILKKENQFKEKLRKINSIKMYFVAIVTISSGLLYDINEYLPFISTTALYIVAFIISFFFTDIKNEDEELKLVDYFTLSFSCIKNNKSLRWLMVASALFTVLFVNQNILLQQYMSDIGLQVSLFGIVFFVYNLISAFVSKRSAVLERIFGKYTKVIFTLLIVICFMLVGIFKNYIGIIILASCRVSIATINPIMDAQVNENIDTKNRATILSFYNAISSIADAIFSPIIGFTIDEIGIFNTYFVLGLVGLLFVIFLLSEKQLRV